MTALEARRPTTDRTGSRHVDMPGVSVVIPTYNSRECVTDAIDSALAQTHAVLEVIVVDDGSTDGTRSVVDRYDERVRYLRRDNGGPARARMTGVSAARGEWVGFLDADDVWFARKLEAQLEAAAAEQAEAVFCANVSVAAGRPVRVCYDGSTARHVLLPALLRGNVLSGGGSTALVRRRVFDVIGGFDAAVNASEDRDLFIRLVDAFPVAYVRRPLARIRMGPLHYGGDPERNRRNSERIVSRHIRRIDGLPGAWRARRRAYACVYERAGMQYLFQGDLRRAWHDLRRAVAWWPFLADPWRALINVCTGRRRYGPRDDP